LTSFSAAEYDNVFDSIKLPTGYFLNCRVNMRLFYRKILRLPFLFSLSASLKSLYIVDSI